MFLATNPSARLRPLWRTAVSLKVAATVVGGTLAVLATGLDGARAAETDPPSKRVSYADLNLRAPQGREALVRRVKLAARQVCRTDGVMKLLVSPASASCFRLTTAHAMAQVDRAIVVAELAR